MSEDIDTALLVKEITDWLDKPHTHLEDQSHRRVIETMVHNHVQRVKRREQTRLRGRDIVLVGAVGTLLFSSVPAAIEIIKAYFS